MAVAAQKQTAIRNRKIFGVYFVSGATLYEDDGSEKSELQVIHCGKVTFKCPLLRLVP